MLKSYSDVGLDANKSEKLKQTKALTKVLMMTMVMLVMPWVGGGSTVERKFNDGGDDPSVVPLHPPAIDPNDVGNDHNAHLGDDDDLNYDGALFIISNGAFPAERISTDSRNLSTLRSSRSAELEC